jgi:hypothetical protein
MSIIVVNLQDNRAVFRIFIALLRFSFDSPSYVSMLYFLLCTQTSNLPLTIYGQDPQGIEDKFNVWIQR